MRTAPFIGGKRKASKAPAIARHGLHAPLPDEVHELDADHPALIHGRTIYRSTVSDIMSSPRLLVSGHNNAKLGKVVQKGAWAGMPLFHLTLEERASCPRSCSVWATCYGNAMHLARRHDHRDPNFYAALEAELLCMQRQFPDGFVVRLHTLGDFFAPLYVKFWARMLDQFPALRAFGYTHNRLDADDPREAATARAIKTLTDAAWEVFAIRSSSVRGPQGSIVVDAPVTNDDTVIMCPAQTDQTMACVTCGFCWSPAAREKTVAFLRHGKRLRGGTRR